MQKCKFHLPQHSVRLEMIDIDHSGHSTSLSETLVAFGYFVNLLNPTPLGPLKF